MAATGPIFAQLTLTEVWHNWVAEGASDPYGTESSGYTLLDCTFIEASSMHYASETGMARPGEWDHGAFNGTVATNETGRVL